MNWHTTVYYAKFAWVAVCIGSSVVNAITFWEALRDMWAVTRKPQSRAEEIRVWQSVRDDAATLIFQVGVLILRLWSLGCPEPMSDSFIRCWVTEASILTLLQVVLAVNCILDLYDRRRILECIGQDGD